MENMQQRKKKNVLKKKKKWFVKNPCIGSLFLYVLSIHILFNNNYSLFETII